MGAVGSRWEPLGARGSSGGPGRLQGPGPAGGEEPAPARCLPGPGLCLRGAPWGEEPHGSGQGGQNPAGRGRPQAAAGPGASSAAGVLRAGSRQPGLPPNARSLHALRAKRPSGCRGHRRRGQPRRLGGWKPPFELPAALWGSEVGYARRSVEVTSRELYLALFVLLVCASQP